MLPPDDQAEGDGVVHHADPQERHPGLPAPGQGAPHHRHDRPEDNRRQSHAQRDDRQGGQVPHGDLVEEERPAPQHRQQDQQCPFHRPHPELGANWRFRTLRGCHGSSCPGFAVAWYTPALPGSTRILRYSETAAGYREICGTARARNASSSAAPDRGRSPPLCRPCFHRRPVDPCDEHLHPCATVARQPGTERWPSGRRRTPGKCVGGKPSRGFESLSLRHLPPRKRSPDPALAGFFRYIRGLCGRG